MEIIENDFGETWVKVEDESFVKKISDCFNDFKENRFWVIDVAEAIENSVGQKIPNEYQDKYWIIDCHMGKNGNGEWSEYFEDIKKVFKNLKEKFERVWLIKWDCDCADDVSYPMIGVSNERK